MKKIIIGIIGIVFLCTIAGAGDREHPSGKAIATGYGMPLTSEEHRLCRKNLNAVADNYSAPSGIVVSQPIPQDIKHLMKIAFPLEEGINSGVENMIVTEDSLIKLKTEGSLENQCYHKIIELLDANIEKLNAVKDIWNRYPGIEKSSKDVWLNWINTYISYTESLKTYFPEIYKYAEEEALENDQRQNNWKGLGGFEEDADSVSSLIRNLARRFWYIALPTGQGPGRLGGQRIKGE